MKDIGFTEKRTRIVEMTESEYNAFSRLCTAVEGKPFLSELRKYPDDLMFQSGYDFTNTFEVIRAFYDSRFKITDLQEHINSILESLNKI